MSVTCLDHGAHPISEPHGPWWVTIRIPLPRTGHHIYIGTSTGRRFTGRSPFVKVRVVPQESRKPRRPDLLWSLHRWCAHIDVSYDEGAA